MISKCLLLGVCVGLLAFAMYIPYKAVQDGNRHDMEAKEAVDARFKALQDEIDTLHAEAIKRGYAQYNQTNGQWNWK